MTSKFLLVACLLVSPIVLANCYDEFAQDSDNFHSCKAAAEQGDATAQYVLATLYNNGQGVEKNSQKAVEWYQKSAEQNNDLAQYSLGIMYEFGDEGLDKNEQEAQKWYRLAANNGNYFAQNKLGLVDVKEGEYKPTITPYSGDIPPANTSDENEQSVFERIQGWFSTIFAN
ncbi:MAG: tetratricopeptide repeat protein [Gammaproteobacteria bacterium]|nr:tetratricopeptide repeat protein [Gammaproteobacteria bacterium]